MTQGRFSGRQIGLWIVLATLARVPFCGSAGADDYPPAPDYADATNWACRPEAESACTAHLDAVEFKLDGTRTLQPFKSASAPAIDCFYVYPTVSRKLQDYAEPKAEPAVIEAIRTQAGRLASTCRLFVPLYRQATLYHLHTHPGDDWEGPYQDVVAAWNFYLNHDNQGRGVVLVGHSQGTILLQRLIAEHIDGQRSQGQLVSAFLIGDPGLMVPPGRALGGTFKHVPVCAIAEQTGCAYAWASYWGSDTGSRAFGVDQADLQAVCTNPENPGGEGRLDAYFERKDFPAAAPEAFARVVGQISAVCQRDEQGSVLRISVPPGPYAQEITAVLSKPLVNDKHRKDWGLHRRDIALAQGSILRLVTAESDVWQREHPPPHR